MWDQPTYHRKITVRCNKAQITIKIRKTIIRLTQKAILGLSILTWNHAEGAERYQPIESKVEAKAEPLLLFPVKAVFENNRAVNGKHYTALNIISSYGRSGDMEGVGAALALSARRQSHGFAHIENLFSCVSPESCLNVLDSEQIWSVIQSLESHSHLNAIFWRRERLDTSAFYIYPLLYCGRLKVDLSLYSSEGQGSKYAAHYSQASQNPIGEVCRGESSFQILFGMRLVISVSLAICGILLIYFGASFTSNCAYQWSRWLGALILGLGLLLLLAPLHWEWFLCAGQNAESQQTEYNQSFQHGGNVPQGIA